MKTLDPSENSSLNASVSFALTDRIFDLGGIDPARIRSTPAPGSATVEDLIRASAEDGRIYELVDKTLVEKAVGWQESFLAMVLAHWLQNFLDSHNLGVIIGPDGLSRLFGDTVRGADVAFISWSRMPDGRLPADPIPSLVPDFVVEVLSIGNTRSEMARKRREYFQAGVRLVWMIDPRRRTVAVFTTADSVTIAQEFDRVDGGDVLPGWSVELEKLFAELDRAAPK
jgi:Uma2 family endonuclease